LLRLERSCQMILMGFIQRGLIASDELKPLIDEGGLGGVTSSLSIFEKAVAGGTEYDDAVRILVLEGKGVDQIYTALIEEDIQRAGNLFRPMIGWTGRTGL
jgi:hypothetical protein